MNPKPYQTILDETAAQHIPDDLNLLPTIAAQYAKQKGSKMKPLYKFGLATLLVLAVLAVIFFTVPPAATAMRNLLGYIPGLGLVEQNAPLRVLAQPVMVEREGVRYIVEKGSSDARRTILLVNVSGVTPGMGRGCPGPESAPRLRLANGETLGVTESNGYGGEKGYTQHLVFAPLPEDAQKVTLEVPCLMSVEPGQAPENWQIELPFIAADPSQLAPVIELPTPAATSAEVPPAANATEPQPAPQSEASPYGIAMKLDKVVELEDGYVLMGSLSWTDPQLGDYAVHAMNPTVIDGDGNTIPFEETAPDTNPEPGSKRSYFAFKVPGKQYAWPLTVKTSATVSLGLPTQPSFPLDLSSPPAPGQAQEINTSLEAGGHTIRVLSYFTGKDPQGNGELKFNLQSDPSVIGASMFDVDHSVLGGGGGGGGGAQGQFLSGFTYNGSLPEEKVNISLTALMLYLDGGWKVTWQP